MNLRYAAIDGWVSYEMYRQLMVMQDLTKHNRPPPLLISENRNSGAGEGSSISTKSQQLWEDDEW